MSREAFTTLTQHDLDLIDDLRDVRRCHSHSSKDSHTDVLRKCYFLHPANFNTCPGFTA